MISKLEIDKTFDIATINLFKIQQSDQEYQDIDIDIFNIKYSRPAYQVSTCSSILTRLGLTLVDVQVTDLARPARIAGAGEAAILN